MYISGGVMAAPTVGSVMAEIFPYLQVRKAVEETNIAVPNLIGKTEKEAGAVLKELGLSYLPRGSEHHVTAQLPREGQTLPQGSQMLLYFGEVPEQHRVEVPDFYGMNRQKASDLAASLGLYILVSGNASTDPKITVTAQSVPPGTSVSVGTTIKLEFADTKVSD
jgi:stage V sporulation protein D (sporulation-specific penicillin-binding protein)